MKFNPYPFEKLRELLRYCKSQQEGINLSIGEPGFNAPESVVKSIQENASLIRYYPSLQNELIDSQINFVKQRFNVELQQEELIPTFGSREVLFNFPYFICINDKFIKNQSPCIAFPNPFYQIYEGTQLANRANVIYMPLNENNLFKPRLSKEELNKVDIVILNSPNNPTGQILGLHELVEWVKLSLEYNFILINDECYSEIYKDTPPPSLLEACLQVGNKTFKNNFVINSISKRLSTPGLRSGFIAGDKDILNQYRIFRTYIGISMPNTLQKASVIAWQEKEYAEFIRKKFATNLDMAKQLFSNVNIFPYTFYLWLNVKKDSTLIPKNMSSDTFFTKKLYEQTGHKVLPGSYLGRNGSGIDYVRIALTQEKEVIYKALQDIKKFIIIEW